MVDPAMLCLCILLISLAIIALLYEREFNNEPEPVEASSASGRR